MHLNIIHKAEQAKGEFNFGAILENKPIGFPGEGGRVKPYSNLFYWAHAWTPGGDSTIGLHPHQGFEIMSFVLDGDIEHYDTGQRSWRSLSAGDMQIIRAGSGISHSEKIMGGASIFQIWMDPNLSVTFNKPASYDDYPSGDFPLTAREGMVVKTYKGEGSPLQMDTPGVRIEELRIPAGSHTFAWGHAEIASAYLISGELTLNEEKLHPDDFFIASGDGELSFEATADAVLFVIYSPMEPGYQTYARRRG